MPDCALYCTECDLTGLLHGPPKISYYRISGDNLPMNWGLGYCENCNHIGRIREKLLSPEEIEKEILTNQEYLGGDEPFFKKLLLQMAFSTRAFRKKIVEEIKSLEKLPDLYQSRIGHEICYECGSSKIIDLTGDTGLPCYDFSYRGNKSTGFVHPSCGGEIWVRANDMRLMYITPDPEMFDVVGNRLIRQNSF